MDIVTINTRNFVGMSHFKNTCEYLNICLNLIDICKKQARCLDFDVEF